MPEKNYAFIHCSLKSKSLQLQKGHEATQLWYANRWRQIFHQHCVGHNVLAPYSQGAKQGPEDFNRPSGQQANLGPGLGVEGRGANRTSTAWSWVLQSGPFQRTRRVTVTHQQEGKDTQVMLHPSSSCSLETSFFILNSPIFEIVGGQLSAAGHVGFASGHRVTGSPGSSRRSPLVCDTRGILEEWFHNVASYWSRHIIIFLDWKPHV